MPLLPLYSLELMEKELLALAKILDSLKDKIPEDSFKKMDEHIEAIMKEIRSAR